ncbi:MAG TPA: DUF4383 domain-containing protein [Allosphingosinicella sp.]|nr:DUF4383 domain-containing protein [Allosphingosinicella sp.]
MSKRRFATILGLLLLIIGILGFVPALIWPAQGGALAMDSAHGLLFGIFPVNAAHNGVHVLFGLWGLAAARSARGAMLYARAVAILYSLLTLMGMIPGLDDLFGLMPLYGNDLWLHAGIAATSGYFGWAHLS